MPSLALTGCPQPESFLPKKLNECIANYEQCLLDAKTLRSEMDAFRADYESKVDGYKIDDATV
ncbi:hypothetical protein FKW77_001346 [Venturia effusa]|uniref:Uncharacterized protein n=1 Tax=Venturia effusa TaxID=50376 RepID=A0A517LQN1_9PEZI|nr:hypothetical protein FKW77_001346 [Venturia effusa]